MKKRILSILLAICMVVGLLPGTALTASAAESAGEMTIYFQNNWLWTDVCIYYWGSAGSNPDWPGNAMEYVGNDGKYDIYKATVPTDVTGIVVGGIKNDGSGNLDKTPDITSGWYDGICYWMLWNDRNEVRSADIRDIYPDALLTYVAEVEGQQFENLAEAIRHAQTIENSTVKLLDSVSMNTSITIDSGKFTIDLNGKTWESSTYALYVQGTADVRLTSTADGDVLRGTHSGCSTVMLWDTARLEIAGGTVENTGLAFVVDMSWSGNPTQARLIISGGKVATNGNIAVLAFGSAVTVTGGTMESEMSNIAYYAGVLDLSSHANPAGIKIEIGRNVAEALVGTDILLPPGFCFVDRSGHPVTTLQTYGIYTVAEAAPTPTYVAEVEGQQFENLAEAIRHAQTIEGSTVKLLDNVTLDTEITIDSGKFTIDLAGKTWESSVWALYVQGTADVRLTSTADGGVLRGTGSGYPTIIMQETGELEIAGGTVENTGLVFVVDMSHNGHPTQSQLIISGGKLVTNNNYVVYAYGSSVTVTGGTLESTSFHFNYHTGVLDLSDYDTPAGMKIGANTDILVGTDILLPEGYCFVDSSGNEVTTLPAGTVYTVAVDETPAPTESTVTDMYVPEDTPGYDPVSRIFVISPNNPLYFVLEGENLTAVSDSWAIVVGQGANPENIFYSRLDDYATSITDTRVEIRLDIERFGATLAESVNGVYLGYITDPRDYATYVPTDVRMYYSFVEVEPVEGVDIQLPYGLDPGEVAEPVVTLEAGYENWVLKVTAIATGQNVPVEDGKFVVPAGGAIVTAVESTTPEYATKAQLEAAIAELEAKLADLEQIHGAEVSTLQTDLAALKAALAALDETYATDQELADAIAALNTTLAELTNRITTLETTYATKAELEQAIEELNAAIAAGDAANAEALAEAVATLEKALADAVAALEKTDADNKAALEALISEAKTTLEAALAALEERVEKNETDIAALQAALQKAIDELNAAIAAGDAANAEALAEAVATLEKALADAVAALEKTDADNKAALEKMISEAEAALETAIAKLRADLEDAVADLENADKENAEALAQAIQDLSAAIEAAKAVSAAEDAKIRAELAAAQAALQSAISSLSAQLNATRTQLLAAIAAGDKALDEKITALAADLEAAVAAAEAADEALKAELNARIDEAVAALEAAIAAVAENLAQAQQELQEAIDAGDKKLHIRVESLGEAMGAALAAAQAADEALKMELNARIDQAVAALEAAIAQTQKNLDEVKAQLMAKDEQLAAKDAQLNTLVIVAIVLGGMGVCGCAALMIFLIVDKRKKAL